MLTLVSGDLDFVVERQGAEPITGRLRGRENRLVLDVDHAEAFAGAGDASFIRQVAEGLATRGIAIRVVQGERHLVTLGAVSAPWWQRRFTGSRRIRLGSLRGALASARARALAGREAPLFPSASLLPPGTMWPPVPTFTRRPRKASTTHDPGRGGAPRLVLVKQDYWAGERQPVFWLHDGSTIGSDPTSDICLPGLAAHHAVVRHDDADEWVIQAVDGVTRVAGAPVVRQKLRTGARVNVGDHQLGFFREEHADHGRPHGGRTGGELGRQQRQAPRPAASHGNPEF